MPTNVLQKNQSYPELGYRIDGRGIAYDLETGQPLSRQDVDARIAQAEAVDPSSNDYAERQSNRGGIAGIYDRNKDYIDPIASIGLGLINPALGAAYGAATGFDKEGEGGIGYDPMKGAVGAVSGYGLGKVGGALGNAAQTGARVAAGNGLMTGIKEGAKTLLPSGGIAGAAKSLLGGGDGGSMSGLSAKDWLGAISGAVGAGLDYKQGQSNAEEDKNRYARDTATSELKTAANAQNLLNRAPMADNAQALLMARMGGAPTTFAPRDYTRGPMTAQTMAAPATGGPQDALASARTAAANYQPGQGGVDTSALEILKKRMFQNAKVGV